MSSAIQSHNLAVEIKILPHAEGLPLPRYATAEAAGMDLYAAIETPLQIKPLQRLCIPCGFALALSAGWEAQIRPRSGLALRFGLTVLNSPGTIDADYRGEVCALMINLGDSPYVIQPAERIAQMVIAPVTQVQWRVVSNLTTSERGQGGFGSTGSKDEAS